jgi:hypothetical protein
MRIFFTLLFICLISFVSRAQHTKVIRDLQSWTSAGVKKDFGKKFAASAEFEYRTRKNMSLTEKYFVELGGEYDISKSFEAGLAYRFIRNRKKDLTYKDEYRWQVSLAYKKGIKRWDAGLRLQYQNLGEKVIWHGFDNQAVHSIRSRIELKYDIPRSKIEPAFSYELFNSVDQHYFKPYQMWFTFEGSYNLKKYGSIKGFYRIERELNDEVPYINYIIGLKYRFHFKSGKKEVKLPKTN